MSRFSDFKILLLTPTKPENPLYGFHLGDIRPPLGLGYIAANLRKNSFFVNIIDFYGGDSFVDFNNYNFIGIQINSACFNESIKLAKKIRTSGFRGKLIAGGAHATLMPHTIPNMFDYIVRGEGEYSILDIIEGREQNRIINSDRILDLDALPRVAYDLFRGKMYNKTIEEDLTIKNVFTYSSSRGCPYRCAFCSTKGIYGRKWTCHSADRVLDDIEYLITDFKAGGIYFREDNFSVNVNRVVSICEKMLSRKLRIKWKCETRVDLPFDCLKMMAKAGCVAVYIGIESGSPDLLKDLKKDIDIDQIKKFVNFCKKVNIKTYGSFIEHTPFEKERDRKLTFNLIKDIKLDRVNISKYIAMPGSELYEKIKKNSSLARKYGTSVIC